MRTTGHVDDRFGRYEAGLLPTPEHERVTQHLAACDRCRARLETVRGAERLLSDTDGAEAVDLVPAVLARLAAQRARGRARRLAMGAVASAVLLALAGVLAYPPARAQAAALVRGVAAVIGYMGSIVGVEGNAEGTPVPQLAYVDTNGTIWLVNAEGRNRRKLLEGCSPPDNGQLWSPDGTRITCVRQEDDPLEEYLVLADTEGRVLRELAGLYGLTSAIWSPTGDHVAYEAGTMTRDEYLGTRTPNPPVDPDPEYMVFTYQIANRNGTVTGQVEGVRLVAVSDPGNWSADGSTLAFATATGDVVLYDVASGQRRDLGVGRVRDVTAWVLGDRALLVELGSPEPGRRRDGAALLDLATNGMRPIPSLPGRTLAFDISPDGSRVAFARLPGNGEPGVGIVDLTDGEVTWVQGYRDEDSIHGLTFSPDGSELYWLGTVPYWLGQTPTPDRVDRPLRIYRATADGSGLTLLAELPDGAAWLSPDGTKVAYTVAPMPPNGQVPARLWIADVDGSKAVEIGDTHEPVYWRPPRSDGDQAEGAVGSADCPVDPVVCGFAADLNTWLLVGDLDTMVTATRPEEHECRWLGSDPQPLCQGSAPGERRRGYSVGILQSDGGGIVTEEEYRGWLYGLIRPPAGAPDAFGPAEARLYSVACPEFQSPEEPCRNQFVVLFSMVDGTTGQSALDRHVAMFLVRRPDDGPSRIEHLSVGPLGDGEAIRIALRDGGSLPYIGGRWTFHPWRPADTAPEPGPAPDLLPMRLGDPVPLPEDLALIIETGCWQCDGPPEGLVRVYRGPDGNLRTETLFEAPDGEVITGFAIAPDGSSMAASVCSGSCPDLQGAATPEGSERTRVLASTDGGVTWSEVGAVDGRAQVVNYDTGGTVVGVGRNRDPEEMSKLRYVLLPEGRELAPPVDGAYPVPLPYGGLGWRTEDGRLLGADGTPFPEPPPGVRPFALAGVPGRRGEFVVAWRGGDAPDARTALGVVGPTGRVSRAFETPRPVYLLGGVVRPGLAFGNLYGEYRGLPDQTIPALLDLETVEARPLEIPRLGRTLVRAVMAGPFARVTTEGSCLEVRGTPTGKPVACLADGVLLRDTGAAQEVGGETWARFVAPAGQVVWIPATSLER